MKFDDLVNKEFLAFYGVDNNCFRLGIIDTEELLTYEAIEDQDDGYRSYLDSVEIKDPSGLIFFQGPVAIVSIEHTKDSYSDIFEFKDVVDNHIWLRVGTENCDDYYPWFVFEYSAKFPA